MSYCRGLVSQAMMKRQKRPHVRKNPALGAQHLNALAPTRTSTPNDGSVNTLSDKEGSDKNGKVPKQVENISKIMRNSLTKFHFFTSTDLTYGSFVRPIWHIAFSPLLTQCSTAVFFRYLSVGAPSWIKLQEADSCPSLTSTGGSEYSAALESRTRKKRFHHFSEICLSNSFNVHKVKPRFRTFSKIHIFHIE